MKRKRPKDMACMIFDDRDYGINSKNAMTITNFFQRSSWGLSMDSIVKTPFFAISQAQNVGLQLADLVVTVISLRFALSESIKPHYDLLKKAIPTWESTQGAYRVSGLKVMRDITKSEERKRQATHGPRPGQESPAPSAG